MSLGTFPLTSEFRMKTLYKASELVRRWPFLPVFHPAYLWCEVCFESLWPNTQWANRCHDTMMFASRKNLPTSKMRTENENIFIPTCDLDDLTLLGGHCRTNHNSCNLIVMIICVYVPFTF